jgi:hypothetical protein
MRLSGVRLVTAGLPRCRCALVVRPRDAQGVYDMLGTKTPYPAVRRMIFALAEA